MTKFNVYRVSDDGSLSMETGCETKASAVRSAKYLADIDRGQGRDTVRVVVRETPTFGRFFSVSALRVGQEIGRRVVVEVVRSCKTQEVTP